MNDNGKEPAFPILDPNSSFYREGLTKREYFAGLAMQALLADPLRKIETDAELAVITADALLAELAKTEKP